MFVTSQFARMPPELEWSKWGNCAVSLQETVFKEQLSIINDDFLMYPTRSPCTYVGECMLMNCLFVTALISFRAYENALYTIATVGIYSAIVIWQTDKVRSELGGVKSELKKDIKDVEEKLQGVEEKLQGVAEGLHGVEERLQDVEERIEVVVSEVQRFELKRTDYIQLEEDNIQSVDSKLKWVAGNWDVPIAEMLLEKKGVYRDTADMGGHMPFSGAADNGCQRVVMRLLERSDANPDTADTQRPRLGSRATGNGHVLIAKMLLERIDVHPDVEDESDRTPFAWASIYGRERVLGMLQEQNGLPAKPAFG
ncbi:hypothetical protein HOY82DRAFT_595584 [Tuber indicum]|nr:hypothetical protein HOY82DRAFT_595584 [Tuber indicum]